MLQSFNRFIMKYFILQSLALLVFVVIIASTYPFESLNNLIYDQYLYQTRSKEKQNDIVIIKIDSKSINKIGEWPWNRKLHADLLDIIFKNGAKVAGFYSIFSSFTDKESDNIFIDTLKKHPTVVLDNRQSLNYRKKNNIIWERISKSSSYGHHFFSLDKNNVIRSQILFAQDTPSFPLAIIKIIDPAKYNKYRKLATQHDTLQLINFKRTEQSFPGYSYKDVIEHKFPENAFKDKIVLIAPTAKSISDYYITPFSRNQSRGKLGASSAIFIQAQILDSLLHFDIIFTVNPLILYILIFMLSLTGLNILSRLGLLKQVILSFIVFPVLMILFSFITLTSLNIWMSPLYFIFAFLLSFLYISITTIRKTSNFLDNYIADLTARTKKEVALDSDSSVDAKLQGLKELTDLISTDKEVLEAMLVSVSSLIILFNKDGTILFSNDKKYFKPGQDINNLTESFNLDEIKLKISENKLFDKYITLDKFEYRFLVTRTKDNFFVGILNDITDMVKMNQMKSDMIRMLSHEFKTPLASILICSDHALDLEDKEDIDRYLNKITTQTEYLEVMIKNFLQLNKLEVTEFQINREPVSINELISVSIESLKVIADEKNISIVEQLDNNLPENICLDKKYMQIVINNLIDNAIKYSPPDTEITVSTATRDQNLIISVKDNGFGISQENLDKLFEKFYRIKNDKTKGIRGTGLGLSFVKKIAELHNGKITVKSQENTGSEFIINLPLA